MPFPSIRAATPLAALLLAACGGGGGSTPSPVTVTLTSTASLDGVVFAGGTTTLTSNITAGDYANGLGPQGGLRGFVSFDITGIPAGATVQSATLTLTQRLVASDPFTTLGVVLVDEVVYGGLLEAGAYNRTFPLSQGFATLSSDAGLGPRTITVTTQVQDNLSSGRPQCQFRLRFPVEDDLDMDSDQVAFWSADTATNQADLPTLVVTYVP